MDMLEHFGEMLTDFFAESPGVGEYVKSNTSYDPITQDITSVEERTTIQCIVLDYTLQSNGYTLKNGTLIQAGDKQVFVRPPKSVGAPNNFTIDPAKDKIVIEGVQYNIVTFKQVNPTMGGDALLYEFCLRV